MSFKRTGDSKVQYDWIEFQIKKLSDPGPIYDYAFLREET